MRKIIYDEYICKTGDYIKIYFNQFNNIYEIYINNTFETSLDGSDSDNIEELKEWKYL